MVGNEADPHIHLVGEECRSDTRPGVGLENPSPKGPSSITLEEDRMRLTTTFLLAMLPLAAMACADDQAGRLGPNTLKLVAALSLLATYYPASYGAVATAPGGMPAAAHPTPEASR